MKSTGIVRKLDELGRVVLPMEVRKKYDINEKDPLEIFVDGERIVLRKYAPACIFCDEAGEVVDFMGRKICKGCMKKLKEI